MKQKVIRFLILILSGSLYSQQNYVSITGVITTKENNEPVYNALIHLRISSGLNYECKTDSLGYYHFKIKDDTVSTFKITIATDKQTVSKSFKFGFLASRDFGYGKLNGTIGFVKNFELNPVMRCGPIAPTIYLKKNSLISCNDSLFKIDSIYQLPFYDICSLLYNTLKDNPTIAIQLDGHASKQEKNPDDLSMYRAQMVKEILVSKGINEKRIQTKGWGTMKLLVKDDVIKKAKTIEEKQTLHSKNQRVVFRILSWDFNE